MAPLRRSTVVALLLSLLAGSPALAFETYRADLSGLNEVPPNGSAGSGVAHVVIDPIANTLKYHISYGGLTGAETAAHIHGFAGPGANAGVVHGLPGGQPKVGTWTFTEPQQADILAGLTYINIHSTAFPGGEIRGQIVPDPTVHMVAVLGGAQEVPPNASSGMGIGFFTINPVTNILSYDIRFAGMTGTETAAHIHGFAPPGSNAGVVHGLPTGSPKVGTWLYMEAQEANILADLTYVNIHSTVAPGGEIRGQVLNLVGPTDVALPSSEAGSERSLHAFPNPIGNGSTALFYRAAPTGALEIDVVDVQGRVVRRLHRADAGGDGSVAWDTRDDAGRPVATGIYFARLTTRGESLTRRLVVLR